MKRGALIVSLDFELDWGYNNPGLPLEHFAVEEGLTKLKSLLDRYDIHCTWATVGGLFQNRLANNEGDNTQQAYHWISKYLQNDQRTEIGSHSSAHLFMQESDQARVEADFQAMEPIRAGGFSFETLVFPRNQYNTELLNLAMRHGIRYFRSVKRNRYLQSSKFSNESRLLRLLKRGAELIPLPRPVEVFEGPNITGISDSRFFRFFPNTLWGDFLSKWYYTVLKWELRRALRQGQAYHIWFHPHNLITRPYRFRELENFLRYFKELQAKYPVESFTIKEYIASQG